MDSAELETGEGFQTAIAFPVEVPPRSLQGIQRKLPIAANPSSFSVEEAQSCILRDHLPGQLLEPLVHQPEPTRRDDLFPVSGYQSRSLTLEAGSEVVMNGFRPLLRRLEIGGGMNVQANDLCLRPFRDKTTLEEVAKEVVVAVAILIQSASEKPPVLEA